MPDRKPDVALPHISQLVPHQRTMSLLDRVVDVDGDRLVAEVVVTRNALFAGDEGVGGWVGIEYMAQAVAAWAGWQGLQQGRPPRIGFLLGTRRYRSAPRFALGSCLRIHVERSYQADNGLGQFDCRIVVGELEVASAQITVFGPEDPGAFLKGEIE